MASPALLDRTDVATDHRALVTRLRGVGKSNEGVPGYSRWLNRLFGRHLAALAYRLGLTPNQVTLLSGTCTMAAIAWVALARPTVVTGVLITLLLLLGYALDSADGQLARLRGGGSPAGEWLDHVFDALKNSVMHLAVVVCWFRFYGLGSASWLLVPLGFAAVSSTFFMAMLLADFLRRVRYAGLGVTGTAIPNMNPNQKAPVLRSLVVLPNDYGVWCLAMVLLPAHHAFIGVYTVLFACNAVFLIIGAARWFREMTALGRSA